MVWTYKFLQTESSKHRHRRFQSSDGPEYKNTKIAHSSGTVDWTAAQGKASDWLKTVMDVKLDNRGRQRRHSPCHANWGQVIQGSRTFTGFWWSLICILRSSTILLPANACDPLSLLTKNSSMKWWVLKLMTNIDLIIANFALNYSIWLLYLGHIMVIKITIF